MTHEYEMRRDICRLQLEQTSQLRLFSSVVEHVVKGFLADMKLPKIMTAQNEKVCRPSICSNFVVSMPILRFTNFPGQNMSSARTRNPQRNVNFPSRPTIHAMHLSHTSCTARRRETQKNPSSQTCGSAILVGWYIWTISHCFHCRSACEIQYLWLIPAGYFWIHFYELTYQKRCRKP